MTSFTMPFGSSRTTLWRNAGKLIETDESLHHNRRGTFQTFTVKKGGVPK